MSLTICSIKLESIYGNIFCLPQKYPLIIAEILINGIVSDIQIIGKINDEFLSKLVDNIGENNITITIIKIFINKDIGIIDISNVLALELSSDIILDIALEYEKTAITLKSDEVGDSIL